MQKEMQSFSETCYACTNVSCCIAILDANRIIATIAGVAQSSEGAIQPQCPFFTYCVRTSKSFSNSRLPSERAVPSWRAVMTILA